MKLLYALLPGAVREKSVSARPGLFDDGFVIAEGIQKSDGIAGCGRSGHDPVGEPDISVHDLLAEMVVVVDISEKAGQFEIMCGRKTEGLRPCKAAQDLC